MQTSFIILALLGWLFSNVKKISKTRAKLGEAFNFGIYLFQNLFSILLSLMAAIILLGILPEYTVMTKTLAFLIGYASQTMLRELMKKNTWIGLFK